MVMLYKALGDERRLHVLKKLATDTYTMQELADMLGVAKSPPSPYRDAAIAG